MIGARRAGAFLAAAGIVALAGCGHRGDASSDRGEAGSYLSRSGPLHLRPADDGDAPAAEVSGEVSISGECVALRLDRDRRALIVWPTGTTWDGDRGEVRVDDELTYADGDRIEGSGAYVEDGPGPPNEWDREILAQVDAVAARCGPLDLAVSVYPSRDRPGSSEGAPPPA